MSKKYTVPPRFAPTYARRANNPQIAIKAYCQMCQGYSGLPASTRDCASTECPLWSWRPLEVENSSD